MEETIRRLRWFVEHPITKKVAEFLEIDHEELKEAVERIKELDPDAELYKLKFVRGKPSTRRIRIDGLHFILPNLPEEVDEELKYRIRWA